jgi:hypothetical protein
MDTPRARRPSVLAEAVRFVTLAGFKAAGFKAAGFEGARSVAARFVAFALVVAVFAMCAFCYEENCIAILRRAPSRSHAPVHRKSTRTGSPW